MIKRNIDHLLSYSWSTLFCIERQFVTDIWRLFRWFCLLAWSLRVEPGYVTSIHKALQIRSLSMTYIMWFGYMLQIRKHGASFELVRIQIPENTQHRTYHAYHNTPTHIHILSFSIVQLTKNPAHLKTQSTGWYHTKTSCISLGEWCLVLKLWTISFVIHLVYIHTHSLIFFKDRKLQEIIRHHDIVQIYYFSKTLIWIRSCPFVS